MVSLSEDELVNKLFKAGGKLEYLFQPKDVLLSTLEEVEGCLHMVNQSPSQVKQAAMIPTVSSLGKQKVLRHTDKEIRLMVTSCLSES
jgi:hypothetical protein